MRAHGEGAQWEAFVDAMLRIGPVQESRSRYGTSPHCSSMAGEISPADLDRLASLLATAVACNAH